ncbi:hypothetical protein SBA7_900029 [Candidatus Sulfotelmatobacter sp. SbA7]|nr:hypothetical protein SBA7_900029 [Candidatus Sulfotelmatobacter sp. SbA7]
MKTFPKHVFLSFGRLARLRLPEAVPLQVKRLKPADRARKVDQNKIVVRRGSWVVGVCERPTTDDQRPALLTIKFYNQLLIDRQLNFFALGQGQHLAPEVLAVDLQPTRRILMTGKFLGLLENRQLAATLADGNLVAHIRLVRGDVDLAAVHMHVAVAHQLAGLTTGNAEAEAMHDRVQAAFQLLQKHFASHTLGACRFLEVVTELAFLSEVHALGLLLFAQLQTVAHDFRLAVLTVLAGGEVALLDGTLIAEAFWAFEEELNALAAAETTYGIGITRQVVSPLDDRFTGLASPFFPDDEGLWPLAIGFWLKAKSQ